jgi:molecular chaperone GrpE
MTDDGDAAGEETPGDAPADDGTGGAETPAGDAGEAPDDADTPADDADAERSLVERVEDHDPDLATEVAALADRATELEDELEDSEARVEELESKLKRERADFQNYKKRREREEEKMRERATEDLVERLLDVRDDLLRALDQDVDDASDLREGVKMTRREFDRVLDAEGVAEIAPDPGDDVDPQRHEVMTRVDSDQPEGTVADVYEPGYEMGEKVLRAAKVTVADGE